MPSTIRFARSSCPVRGAVPGRAGGSANTAEQHASTNRESSSRRSSNIAGTSIGREVLARCTLAPVGAPRGGVYHVAFRTEPAALDAACEVLRRSGLAVSGPIDFPTGRRSCFFEDPDQHYIELTDR